jgi:hypothetical protein
LTIAATAFAMPVAAQAPAPTTAFDGAYVGTATPEGGGRAQLMCGTITSVNMTITDGQVVIHETFFNGGGADFRGSVDAAGEVTASRYTKAYSEFSSVSGTIHDKAFAGHRVIGQGRICYFSVQMQKAPPPTMPFDGDYVGVSRESSGGGADCPPNGIPVTLIIRNSVVTGGTWQGNVNRQGALVMRNRLTTQVEGQIDGQGIIRAQGSNAAGCAITFVWRKQAG